MAWEAVYEDLAVFSSETTDYRDLPVDGLQALVVDGRPCCGFDVCGFDTIRRKEAVLIPRIAVRESELRKAHPKAHIVRTRNTSTIQFHRVERKIGLWASENKKYEPHEGWEKDEVGWRLWTETEKFDSSGIPESDWLDYWNSLPSDGLQFVCVYENWLRPDGQNYERMVAGRDYCYLWKGPFGYVWGKDDDLSLINERYPGASVKRGTLMPDDEFASLLEELYAAGAP